MFSSFFIFGNTMPDANLNIGIKVNTELNSLREFNRAIKEQKDAIIELKNKFGELSPQVKNAENGLKDLQTKLIDTKQHLKDVGVTSKMSGQQLLEMGENLTTLVAGITVAISKVVDFAKEIGAMALKGAEVAEMRKYFDEMNGGIENASGKFEGLKQASNFKLSDEEILRFSNRMDDLGYSTVETTQLMDLAERKSDELGITIQESAMKFTTFIETGRSRGLYSIGVSFSDVSAKIKEMTGLTSTQLKAMDASDQQTIRKNAVLALYGKSLDEISSKEKTTEATLVSIGVAFENAKIKVGEFVSGGIAKLAEIFGLTSEKMATIITITGLVIGSIMAITAAVIGLTIAFGALDIATGGILIAVGLLVTAGAVIAGLKMSNDMENSVKSIKEEIGKTTGEIITLKTELKDLNTLQELTTGTVIDGEKGYEIYKTTLEDLSKKYPGLTNGITINKQALDNETNAVKENIARKEELIRLDLEKEISSQVKAFISESEQLEKNKTELEDWKQKLIDVQKANDTFKPTFELAGIQEAKDKIAELSRSIALTEQPIGKLKRNFMDFLAEGIKTGNVSFAMEKLGIYTKNNTVLQGALRDAVRGLSGSFIAEYLGINKALEKSAELQAMWVQATLLNKMGFLDTAGAMFLKVADYAKNIKIDIPKNDTGGHTNSNSNEKDIKDLTEIQKIMKEIKDLETTQGEPLDLEQLSAYYDKVMVLINSYKEGTDEWLDIKKELNSLDEKAGTVSDKLADEYIKNAQRIKKADEEKLKRDEETSKAKQETSKLKKGYEIEQMPEGVDKDIANINVKYDAEIENINRVKEAYNGQRIELLHLISVKRNYEIEQVKANAITEKEKTLYGFLANSINAFSTALGQMMVGTAEAGQTMKQFLKTVGQMVLSYLEFLIVGSDVAMFTKAISTFGLSLLTDAPLKALAFGSLMIAQGMLAAFAQGGYVSGAGSENSDSIPAMLSNGEYVLRASAVQNIGIPQLNAMNNGSQNAINSFSNMGSYSNKNVNNNNVYIASNIDGVEFLKTNFKQYQQYKRRTRMS